jgi:hypothetical protein
MNLSGNGFSYTKSRFSLNGVYAKSHKEIVHLLITAYKHDKIILHKQLMKLFLHKKENNIINNV